MPTAIGLILALLAACGGASDDEEAERSSSSIRCELSPGEDVCGRTFEGVASSEQERLRVALEPVSSFAGRAAGVVAAIDDACREGLADLGAPAATDGTASCDALVAAIGADGRAVTVKVVEPAACAELPAPACLGSSAPSRARCSGGAVVGSAAEGASPAAQRVAAMVTKRYGAVVAQMGTLESLTSEVPRFAGSVGSTSELPDACVKQATELIERAVADVRSGAGRSAALMGAVGQ